MTSLVGMFRSFTNSIRRWSRGDGARHATTFLALAAIGLIWASFYLALREEKQQIERGARQELGNLTRVFEEQIIRSFKAVDQTLLYVRDAYRRDPDRFDLGLWSRNGQIMTDFAFQLTLVDRNGIIIASSLGPTTSKIDLSDRDHIRVHMQSGNDEMFIGRPVLGRVSKQWSINATRRISAADGTLGGVVVVSLDPAYLTRFYDQIDVGAGGLIALVGMDGIIRARANGRFDPYRRRYEGQRIVQAGRARGRRNLSGGEHVRRPGAVDGLPQGQGSSADRVRKLRPGRIDGAGAAARRQLSRGRRGAEHRNVGARARRLLLSGRGSSTPAMRPRPPPVHVRNSWR